MKGKTWLYVALPLVVLVVLYAMLKPQRAAERRQVYPAPTANSDAAPAIPPVPAATVPAESQASAPSAKPGVFEIVVQGGRRISEPAVFKVRKGDDVTLRINSDRADEVHLHGYDLHARVAPGKPATLTFTAKLTGRFTFELHRSGLELGAVEVFPQ